MTYYAKENATQIKQYKYQVFKLNSPDTRRRWPNGETTGLAVGRLWVRTPLCPWERHFTRIFLTSFRWEWVSSTTQQQAVEDLVSMLVFERL